MKISKGRAVQAQEQDMQRPCGGVSSVCIRSYEQVSAAGTEHLRAEGGREEVRKGEARPHRALWATVRTWGHIQ